MATFKDPLEVSVSYLEMKAPPTRPTVPVPPGKIALMRAEAPTVSFYRYLYNTVGEPWLWWERRKMSDDDLKTVISDPDVEIYVLYVDGVPAGYGELDRRQKNTIELAYMGLMPEFIGRGLGNYLLNWVIDAAWVQNPDRLWVNTCSLDHANALALYQKVGFQIYDRQSETIENPAPHM